MIGKNPPPKGKKGWGNALGKRPNNVEGVENMEVQRGIKHPIWKGKGFLGAQRQKPPPGWSILTQKKALKGAKKNIFKAFFVE